MKRPYACAPTRRTLVLPFLSLIAWAGGCGDDDAPVPPADAGIDGSPLDDAGTDAADAGTDAADAGTDAPLAIFDAGPIALPSASLCGDATPIDSYPAPNGWAPNHGPGISTESFEADALYQHCAYLDGGEEDLTDHHNLVTMYDGYLMMPWAPEWGAGGITFWDISDGCNPVLRGSGHSPTMRETHTLAFSHEGGAWAITASLSGILEIGKGGIQFWDVSDTSNPRHVTDLEVPAHYYPDAYGRIIMSAFWQVPFVYLGAGYNGVYIVDATDPTAPVLAAQVQIEPEMRVGQVHAIGNLLIVSSTSGARTILYDISDLLTPRPIPGGDFLTVDGAGDPRESYFSNFSGGILYFARKDDGGGVLAMDIRNPAMPVYHGDIQVSGSGGYVFLQNELAFVGMGSRAAIFNVGEPDATVEIAEAHLEGDLDTFTPIGHLGVLSVDADAIEDQGSAIIPVAMEPDTRSPVVNFAWPQDGATHTTIQGRVGVSLDEHVDVRSAFEGSVRLYQSEDNAPIPVIVSAQENLVNAFPRCPLQPGTRYTLELPAGGITDLAGNALEETFTMEFETAP